MRKYEMRICKCGRIHMLDAKLVDSTCYSNEKNNMDIALICGGCGSVVIIGADYGIDMYIEPEEGSEPVMAYSCYSYSLDKDTVELNPEAFAKPTKIIYDKGYKVPMKSGDYADYYYNGNFTYTGYPDFWKIQRTDITVDEIMEFIDTWNKERTQVNMDCLISALPDDVLEDLSKYWIDAFNWKGTKYEK